LGFVSIVIFCLLPGVALAQSGQAEEVVDVDVGVDVEVDTAADVEVVQRGDGGDPTQPRILTVRQPPREPGPAELTVYQPPPEPEVVVVEAIPLPEADPLPPEPDPGHAIAWMRWGIFVDELSLGSLGLAFDNPEINALDGAQISLSEPWGSPIVGGFNFGSGARPLPWLRIPEISLSIGGGSPDGAWVGMADGSSDFEARLTSMLLLRAELAGGIELDLGPIRPFALGRVGVAGYFVDADIRHADLGDLGTETLSTAAFETGFDVGVAIRIADDFHVTAQWRETFGDARWRGGMVGISGGFSD
jgi:hypothetical protein